MVGCIVGLGVVGYIVGLRVVGRAVGRERLLRRTLTLSFIKKLSNKHANQNEEDHDHRQKI